MNPALVLIPFLLPEPLCSPPFFCETKEYQWRFIGNHWVATQDIGRTPFIVSNCPSNDMVEVKGKMITTSGEYPIETIEALQRRTCANWRQTAYPEICQEFDKIRWTSVQKSLPRKDMHFCIDPYEWPNQQGATPWTLVAWNEAQQLCESRGKRLCTEEEWTFACEGEEATPYPIGYNRDSQKCNIDNGWIQYSESAIMPRGTEKCGREMSKLWQGESSGTREQCVSSFGVHDMTGNVDEWTTATQPGKFPSILKGGYWARVRNRCRASTRSHEPNFFFYQQGFRCCADPKQNTSR